MCSSAQIPKSSSSMCEYVRIILYFSWNTPLARVVDKQTEKIGKLVDTKKINNNNPGALVNKHSTECANLGTEWNMTAIAKIRLPGQAAAYNAAVTSAGSP